MITRSIEENLPRFTCIGRRVEIINLHALSTFNLSYEMDSCQNFSLLRCVTLV